MDRKIYRLGIIGTGRIAHRFVPEARTVEEIYVAAVCNPRISSAETFAKEQNIDYATDDIEKFMEKVDAVYIATPHETHADYCRQMLCAEKHVLCEKPMSFSKKEAEELFALASEKKLILMEAMKTAYCPGFKALLDIVKSGKIGRVIDVEACFSRISASNVREVWDERYGGSFTEFGTYPLLPIVKLLGVGDKASHVWTLKGKTGVDVYTKTSFDYGTATALVKTGLAVKSEGQLVIAGTKGYILASSPWWLTKNFEVRYEDPNKIEKYEFPYEGQGLRYEVQEFVNRLNGAAEISLTAEESIWFAEKMEEYLKQNKRCAVKDDVEADEVDKLPKIWAHRGCSLAYPENTLSAFRAAAELEGIVGIELDVQLTKDSVMVVIHDETVDRTTNGSGKVCDFTLEEIKALEIQGKDGEVEHIPTMEEVFLLLKEYCINKDLQINIELKNSEIRYEGMEQQLLQMVSKYGLEKYIVYSSFLPESMSLMKELDASVQTGILGIDEAWCKKKMIEMHADAIHPWNGGLELVAMNDGCGVTSGGTAKNYPIRVWNVEEPFFGQERILREKNMMKYGKLGATDVITNVPEIYLKQIL